jgi:hypothetical protein
MRPSDGRISLWPVAVIGFVLILAALSITPAMELRATPPADFVALRASAGVPKTAIAQGYWDVAVRVIQWKYNRGSALPEQMPADFVLPNDVGKPINVENRAIRVAYWEKLREEWLRPESWHNTFSFDLGWVASSFQLVRHEILRFF